MLVVISPAKKIAPSVRDFETVSTPVFQKDANELVAQLQKLSKTELQNLLHISNELANLNNERYLNWNNNPLPTETKQALLTFQGMVFVGLDADTLSADSLLESQHRLRILSGLYGVLRPLDSIQAYRLEMGTKWKALNFSNLYEFWGDRITMQIEKTLQEEGHKTLVNLASMEYFRAVKPKQLSSPIVTPIFKDNRGNGYKVMAVYAKKARGLMTRFIIENKLTKPDDLQAFNDEGYYYNATLSKKEQPVFTRDH